MKQEYLEVLRELRKHHSLFAQFWTVGNLVEFKSPSMPTACVTFDYKTGAGLQFLINPDFWAQLNDHSKAFVISHEVLHVYFEHGRRMRGLDQKLANAAQDVVINHYLVDVFGFEREKLTFGEKYFWRDTVFPGRQDIEPDRCFEYYYQKLDAIPREKCTIRGGGGNEPEDGLSTVDVHDFQIDDDTANAIREVVEDLMDRITPEEVEDFEEMVLENQDEIKQMNKAGAVAGHMKVRVDLSRIVKKRKWETVVKDIVGRLAGMQRDLDIELWIKPSRRMAAISQDLMLPATVNETVPVRDRIDVWFFQDTSGSCKSYAKRFFKAAASLPDDRFRVRLFCFDTKVYETDLKSGKLYGFGGTKFQPMEQEIQSIIQKEPKTKYPQAVFVVTDGDAWDGRMTAEFPNRWHWFLTEYGSTGCIPPGSHHYKLSDYE